ncbi:HlyD family efflux transporter periplasmic adaptor subunit [Chamaesiphon sp. OTE_75_metabat_556]|uniref:HlyD family efflux transporter periplasmic adaptor subunit n=1 Tax=Chamaesiphon sp. OTE_75_metabat_556 TaxID=2964692 RepID=UPI00286C02AF|nr:HlyD family efflux transporter periplasmic adaptor subunit [Chamaesiphon sp. OTE_75_metabat_556]
MSEIFNDREIEVASSAAIELVPNRPAEMVGVEDWSDTVKDAIEALPMVWTRGLFYLLLLFTCTILPWAMLSKFDETGAGRGRIETKGSSNRLESATSGQVIAVRVQEGQSVQQGQVLLELESDAVRAEVQQASTKLEGQMSRLSQLGIAKNQVAIAIATQQQQNKAQAVEKLAQFEQAQQNLADKQSSAPLSENLKLIQLDRAGKILTDSKANLLIQTTEKAAQLRQARQRLAAAKTSLIINDSKYQWSLKELKRYQFLHEQGGIPEVKLVEIQGVAKEMERMTAQSAADVELAETGIKEQESNYSRVIYQLQADIRQSESKLLEQNREYQQISAQQKVAIQQAQSRLKEQQGNRDSLLQGGKLSIFKSEEQLKDLQAQIGTLNTEISQTQQQIKELERQLAQKIIRAPVAGTILQLPFKQPKSFIQTGQLVVQIAPRGASTILKVQMPSENTGFLKTGMPVKVKFDAYPFQDYGVIEGKVQKVSPDSKLVDVGNGKIEAFEVDVMLDRNYIQSQGKRIPLNLGQTATAEVIVRQRQTIDLILDPFKKLQQGG